MKYTLIPLSLFWALTSSFAQSYSEDFESFKSGDYLAKESEAWTTWGNKPGSSEDARIVKSKSFSGNHSVYLNSTSTDGGPQDLILPFGNKYDIGYFEYSMMLFLQSGKGAYFNFQGEKKVGEVWCLQFRKLGKGKLQNL